MSNWGAVLHDVLLGATGIFIGARALLLVRDFRRERYGYAGLHVTMGYAFGVLMFLIFRQDEVETNFFNVSFTAAVLLSLVFAATIFIRKE